VHSDVVPPSGFECYNSRASVKANVERRTKCGKTLVRSQDDCDYVFTMPSLTAIKPNIKRISMRMLAGMYQNPLTVPYKKHSLITDEN